MEENRILFLLAAILLMQLVAPILGDFRALGKIMDVFVTVTLICAVYAASDSWRKVVLSCSLALPTLILTWIVHNAPSADLGLAKSISSALFFGYITFYLLHYLVQQERITKDLIQGAIVIYFLLGIVWSHFYQIVEFLHPGSFNVTTNLTNQSQLIFSYFSFVTLTTLGYGDVTPVTQTAAYLVLLEAVTGQLYMAVVIARLVGIHISQNKQ